MNVYLFLLLVVCCASIGGGLGSLLRWIFRSRRYPVPIADHILVRPVSRPQEVGGMARPLSATERPTEGQVVLVGPGKVTERGVRVAPEVRAGDHVSFPSFAGQTIVDPPGVPLGTYLLVRQDELWLNHGPAEAQEGERDAEA